MLSFLVVLQGGEYVLADVVRFVRRHDGVVGVLRPVAVEPQGFTVERQHLVDERRPVAGRGHLLYLCDVDDPFEEGSGRR